MRTKEELVSKTYKYRAFCDDCGKEIFAHNSYTCSHCGKDLCGGCSVSNEGTACRDCAEICDKYHDKINRTRNKLYKQIEDRDKECIALRKQKQSGKVDT